MDVRFTYRIPEFTDKDKFTEFQYVELGDQIEETLEGHNGEPQQCTGLMDVNNRLIYEGDIVRVDKQKLIVIWCPDSAEFFMGRGRLLTDFKTVWNDQTEVIGNIYENPELLKEI